MVIPSGLKYSNMHVTLQGNHTIYRGFLNYRKRDQYSITVDPSFPTKNSIRHVSEDGEFSASFSISKENLFDTIYVFKNMKTLNKYLIKTQFSGNAMEWIKIVDTFNNIYYDVYGKGPFQVSNILIAGKLLEGE